MYVSNLVLITNRRSHMSSLLLRKSAVFILGTYKGNIPQKALYPPQKNFISGKRQLLMQRKAFSFWGASPITPPEQGMPLDHAGEQPHPRPSTVVSINWCPRCPDTPSVWPCGIKILCANVKKLQFMGTSSPGPHWELPKFRSLSSPSCFSLRLCFSNDVFMVG